MPRPFEAMTTIEMWVEYNSLVPTAQALGYRRFRHLPRCWRLSRLEAIRRLDRLRRVTGLDNNHGYPARVLSTTPVLFDRETATFGVELECFLPHGMSREALAARITLAGIECASEMYNHRTGAAWKVVKDDSLGNEVRGCEVVSPALTGAEGFATLTTVCNVLKEAGCKITWKCGLHVHVGARHQPVAFFRNLVKLYAHFEPAIDSVLAPSRRGYTNSYCGPVRFRPELLESADNMADLAVACHQHAGAHNARSRGRYRKLNLQSFWQHGTVEFRQHQGTVEAAKVEAWVRLCLALAASAAGQPSLVAERTLEGLFTVVQATDGVANFFHRRRASFVRRAEQRVAS